MRSLWKGSIRFGLVYIPVSVYPATREEKVSLKQLRKSELSPIRYKKVAEADDKELPIEPKITNHPKSEKAKAPKRSGGVVDLLAVLQESLRANADKRKGRFGKRSTKPRSTGTYMNSKRTVEALEKN